MLLSKISKLACMHILNFICIHIVYTGQAIYAIQKMCLIVYIIAKMYLYYHTAVYVKVDKLYKYVSNLISSNLLNVTVRHRCLHVKRFCHDFL